jgi:hypothetical protein
MDSSRIDKALSGIVPSRMASRATGSQAASRMRARRAVAEGYSPSVRVSVL